MKTSKNKQYILTLFINTLLCFLFFFVHAGDRGWVRALDFFGLIGVGGHFPRVRGIHRGTVIVEYLGNTVLLVADYSPFASRITLSAGGNTCNGIYSTKSAIQNEEKFVAGKLGESCTDACKRNYAACEDSMIGLLMDCGNQGVCGATKKAWSDVLNCPITGYTNLLTGDLKRAAPGKTKSGKCITTIGRHLSCQGKNKAVARVCVCNAQVKLLDDW